MPLSTAAVVAGLLRRAILRGEVDGERLLAGDRAGDDEGDGAGVLVHGYRAVDREGDASSSLIGPRRVVGDGSAVRCVLNEDEKVFLRFVDRAIEQRDRHRHGRGAGREVDHRRADAGEVAAAGRGAVRRQVLDGERAAGDRRQHDVEVDRPAFGHGRCRIVDAEARRRVLVVDRAGAGAVGDADRIARRGRRGRQRHGEGLVVFVERVLKDGDVDRLQRRAGVERHRRQADRGVVDVRRRGAGLRLVLHGDGLLAAARQAHLEAERARGAGLVERRRVVDRDDDGVVVGDRPGAIGAYGRATARVRQVAREALRRLVAGVVGDRHGEGARVLRGREERQRAARGGEVRRCADAHRGAVDGVVIDGQSLLRRVGAGDGEGQQAAGDVLGDRRAVDGKAHRVVVGDRSDAGVVGEGGAVRCAGQSEVEGLCRLVDGVIDQIDGDGAACLTDGEGDARGTDRRVVAAGECGANDLLAVVVDGERPTGRRRHRDGEGDRRARAFHDRRRIVHREGRRGVVVEDRPGGSGAGDARAGRAGQRGGEGLVVFVEHVVEQRHQDLLGDLHRDERRGARAGRCRRRRRPGWRWRCRRRSPSSPTLPRSACRF